MTRLSNCCPAVLTRPTTRTKIADVPSPSPSPDIDRAMRIRCAGHPRAGINCPCSSEIELLGTARLQLDPSVRSATALKCVRMLTNTDHCGNLFPRFAHDLTTLRRNPASACLEDMVAVNRSTAGTRPVDRRRRQIIARINAASPSRPAVERRLRVVHHQGQHRRAHLRMFPSGSIHLFCRWMWTAMTTIPRKHSRRFRRRVPLDGTTPESAKFQSTAWRTMCRTVGEMHSSPDKLPLVLEVKLRRKGYSLAQLHLLARMRLRSATIVAHKFLPRTLAPFQQPRYRLADLRSATWHRRSTASARRLPSPHSILRVTRRDRPDRPPRRCTRSPCWTVKPAAARLRPEPPIPRIIHFTIPKSDARTARQHRECSEAAPRLGDQGLAGSRRSHALSARQILGQGQLGRAAGRPDPVGGRAAARRVLCRLGFRDPSQPRAAANLSLLDCQRRRQCADAGFLRRRAEQSAAGPPHRQARPRRSRLEAAARRHYGPRLLRPRAEVARRRHRVTRATFYPYNHNERVKADHLWTYATHLWSFTWGSVTGFHKPLPTVRALVRQRQQRAAVALADRHPVFPTQLRLGLAPSVTSQPYQASGVICARRCTARRFTSLAKTSRSRLTSLCTAPTNSARSDLFSGLSSGEIG